MRRTTPPDLERRALPWVALVSLLATLALLELADRGSSVGSASSPVPALVMVVPSA